jgi:hypothetical protein
VRHRSKFVETLVLYATGISIMAVAIAAAVYLHENVPVWEVPAIFASLAVGAIPAAWYVRFKRHGRTASVCSGLLFGLAFMAAVLHEWILQAIAVANVVLILVALTLIVAMSLFRRRQADALRVIGEAVRGTVLFHHDGERIVVYPNRTLVLQRMLILAAFAALFWAIFACVPVQSQQETIMHILAPIVCAWFAAIAVAMLYRLVVHRPTLVVYSDGIMERGSLLATGAGRLGWDEIWSITPPKHFERPCRAEETRDQGAGRPRCAPAHAIAETGRGSAARA